MITQFKKTNLLVENMKDEPSKSKSKAQRPNIDHLIKRIMVERRKEQRKNLVIFSFFLLAIAGSVSFFF